MVKLKTCISLCPLSDPKNFLGLSEDSQSESLIVTLGKNVVLRTRTTDLQQLKSWNIRDQLTAPVVYDKHGLRYIGIFNHSLVKYWNDDAEDYDNAKKYKFASKLHCALTSENLECVLVFFNGKIQYLSQAIYSRREESLPIIKPDEHIVDARLHHDFVTLFVSTNDKQECDKLYLAPLNEEIKPVEMSLKQDDQFLISYHVISNETESYLITLWSDGNLFSSRISLQSVEFPGTLVMKMKTINTKLPVAIQSINSNLLVLYGCDPGEEGALLLIVDTRLRSVVCRHYFKMYSKPPRLWVIKNNILLSMGQYLALVPFQLTSQLLDTRIMTQIPDDSATKTVHWEDNDEQEEELISYESYEQKFSKILNTDKVNKDLINTLDTCAEVPDSILLDCVGIFLSSENDDETEKLLEKILSFPPPKSTQFKSKFDFNSAVDFLFRLLKTDYALFNYHCCAWITCIIDSYYHRFILSEDINIQGLLKLLQSFVTLEVDSLLELSEMKSKLERKLQLLNSGDNDTFIGSTSKTYSYEVVKLY